MTHFLQITPALKHHRLMLFILAYYKACTWLLNRMANQKGEKMRSSKDWQQEESTAKWPQTTAKEKS